MQGEREKCPPTFFGVRVLCIMERGDLRDL